MFNENVAIQIEMKPLSRNERKFLPWPDYKAGILTTRLSRNCQHRLNYIQYYYFIIVWIISIKRDWNSKTHKLILGKFLLDGDSNPGHPKVRRVYHYTIKEMSIQHCFEFWAVFYLVWKTVKYLLVRKVFFQNFITLSFQR
jgi:hypothetical protein